MRPCGIPTRTSTASGSSNDQAQISNQVPSTNFQIGNCIIGIWFGIEILTLGFPVSHWFRRDRDSFGVLRVVRQPIQVSARIVTFWSQLK